MICLENNAQISWSDTLTKFSSYKGTVVAFCMENNIKVHQLYYQRKKAVRDNQPVFHGIKVNKNEIPNPEVQPSDSCLKVGTHIKIELGKAKIYIASDDKHALENILQIMMSIC